MVTVFILGYQYSPVFYWYNSGKELQGFSSIATEITATTFPVKRR